MLLPKNVCSFFLKMLGVHRKSLEIFTSPPVFGDDSMSPVVGAFPLLTQSHVFPLLWIQMEVNFVILLTRNGPSHFFTASC